jgi:hypothetical protein
VGHAVPDPPPVSRAASSSRSPGARTAHARPSSSACHSRQPSTLRRPVGAGRGCPPRLHLGRIGDRKPLVGGFGLGPGLDGRGPHRRDQRRPRKTPPFRSPQPLCEVGAGGQARPPSANGSRRPRRATNRELRLKKKISRGGTPRAATGSVARHRRPVGTFSSASDVTDRAESKQQASRRQCAAPSGQARAVLLRQRPDRKRA